MKEWFKLPQLKEEDLPSGWKVDVIPETDSRLNRQNWDQGQIGMVDNLIVPDGGRLGDKVKVFILPQRELVETDLHEELLS